MQKDVSAIWRVIPDFPKYEVSNLGQVRSRKRQKLLNGAVGTSGYIKVTLREGQIGKTKNVHRLVADAFVDRPDNTEAVYVCHRNGCKTANAALNLYWGTAAENMADRERHGKTCRGERASKYTAAVVMRVRALHALGVSDCETGRLLGIPHPTVRDMRRGRSWGHL